MIWDNSIFDSAFDSAGIRQRVRRLAGGQPVGNVFKGRFDRPQAIVFDGDFHTTDYVLEFTTTDTGPFSPRDELEIEVSPDCWERYRVKQEPLIQGDGHWTRLELQEVRL